MKKAFTIFILGALFVILVSNIMQMPALGSIENPSYNETTRYYIQQSKDETGALNIISAIITDYRAFDTLGETTVLFTSIAAVISVLSISKKKKKEHEHG